MSEPIPMPKTIDEIQALMDREDNSFTRTIAVELPRMVHDGDPRCAFLISGPDAYAVMQCIANFVEALANHTTNNRINAPVSKTLQ